MLRIDSTSTWDEITAAISQLAKGGHGFKTLVIDTADWLEKRLIDHLCRKHSKDSIEDFGYGKGRVNRIGDLAEDGKANQSFRS